MNEFTETFKRLRSVVRYYVEGGVWWYRFFHGDELKSGSFCQKCGPTLASARNTVHEYVALKEGRSLDFP